MLEGKGGNAMKMPIEQFDQLVKKIIKVLEARG